jgi:hypothetical protein
MQISYQEKAPAFANIDNIQEKFQNHFGRIHENVGDYLKLLKEEESFKPPGEKLSEMFLPNGLKYNIHKVSLDDESFHE